MKMIIAVIILSSMLGCLPAPRNLGSFKEVALSLPNDKHVMQNKPVEGEHCRIRSMFTGYALPQIDIAVKDAISKIPGAVGLTDVTISDYTNAVFLEYHCWIVSGLPVN